MAISPDVVAAGALPRQRRSSPPWGVWLTCFICAALIVLLRWVLDVPKLDAAVRNVGTLVLSFIALMTLLVWFAWRSAYPRGLRLAPVVVLLGAAAAGAATLRIEHVDGGLLPTFRWRWLPRADQKLGKAVAATEQSSVDLTTTTPFDYPQFLGQRRNGAVDKTALEQDWAASPPKQVWRQPIGAGWSAFSIVGDHAVTLEQRGAEELVTCYEVPTGKLAWATAIQARHESTLGGVGPRSTPTIFEGRVYALGATGVLRCLEGATGREIWSHDLIKEFGVASAAADMDAIAWGRAASPLIVDQLVVVPAGGPQAGPWVSLVAYDRETGREVWRGGDRQIGYSSPSLVTIDGQQQIVTVNEADVSGHNPQNGRVLWTHDWPGVSNREANASQAVQVDAQKLFVSKGYGGGAMLFEVVPAGDEWKTTELWHHPRFMQTKFSNVVRHGAHLYGLSDGILECIAIETGARAWKKGRYGHGQILLVGDLILVLGETGELALVPADPRGYSELGRIQAIEGKTWNNLALAGDLLLVRNGEEAACYRLATAPQPDKSR